MEKETKTEILARTEYGITPFDKNLIVDITMVGGTDGKDNGFTDGMIIGLIAGSTL